MARFNSKKTTVAKRTETVNKAGGKTFQESPELELASTLLTSLMKEEHYESTSGTYLRLVDIIDALPGDKKFAAQAAIYARNEFGMRSITHVTAALLGYAVKGAEWMKRFFRKVVRRPDDMLEIAGFYLSTFGKQKKMKGGRVVHRGLPNSMKKGFREVLSSLKDYTLAKYKGARREMSLIDLVNLVHPTATPALNKLMKGTLKPAETWETKLTQAGQKAEDEEDKAELKTAAWKELVAEGKLGYMALIRNLRNILASCTDAKTINEVCKQLKDKAAITKSLIFPFRIKTARNELSSIGGAACVKICDALDSAMDLAVENVPEFSGNTLIALDTSGSMGNMSDNTSPINIGSLFAAVLYKRNPGADLMLWDTSARYTNPGSRNDSTITIANTVGKQAHGGGTDVHTVFTSANKKYDRIIILSDMQTWVNGYASPKATFEDYKKRFKVKSCRIYSFNLKDYGQLVVPENEVFAIAGFNEKVFDLFKQMEQDREALVNAIKAIEI